jgi:hypothetical protein
MSQRRCTLLLACSLALRKDAGSSGTVQIDQECCRRRVGTSYALARLHCVLIRSHRPSGWPWLPDDHRGGGAHPREQPADTNLLIRVASWPETRCRHKRSHFA